MAFIYDVCLASQGRSKVIATYKTVRKAHEAFDLISKVCPADGEVSINMREEKE